MCPLTFIAGKPMPSIFMAIDYAQLTTAGRASLDCVTRNEIQSGYTHEDIFFNP